MIERVGFQPYTLPLRRAWSSARGGFAHRHGWLVWVEADGLTGYGDCAPLPAAGTEHHAAAAAALARFAARLSAREFDAASAREIAVLLDALDPDDREAEPLLDPAAPGTPAARFALECALADLASRRLGRSLRHWLAPEAADRVAVNAMLGTLGAVRPEALAASQRHGLRVLKLKVGVGTPASDLAALIALARQPPAGRDLGAGTVAGLRLDANGAWSFDQARWIIERLVRLRLPIESIEEPLAEPTPERLAALQALAPFPLALDESLATRFATLDPARLGVRRLVLKPAALGGLWRTLMLARRAQAAGLDIVVTSLVESAAGLWPTVQLAAAIASPLPHGLATADWLAADLGRAPRPRAGWIVLTPRPGAGFEPALGTAGAPGRSRHAQDRR